MNEDDSVTARPNPRGKRYAARLPAGGFSLDGFWIPPTTKEIHDWLRQDDDED